MSFKQFKKFIGYFSACIVAAVAAKKTLLPAWSDAFIEIALVLLLVPCIMLYIWLEGREEKKTDFENKAQLKEASFLFDLVEEIEKVRPADANDEATAYLANKIIRSELYKGVIGYKKYKKWRERNSDVFSAFLNERDELIGFFDIFPLTDAAADKMLSGRMKESELTIADIEIKSPEGAYRNVYIGSLMVNSGVKHTSLKIAKEIMVIKIYEYIEKRFNPLEDKRFFAYGHTPPGCNLLERAGFIPIVNAQDSVEKRNLYLLQPREAVVARTRYNRIIKRLNNLGFSPSSDSYDI